MSGGKGSRTSVLPEGQAPGRGWAVVGLLVGYLSLAPVRMGVVECPVSSTACGAACTSILELNVPCGAGGHGLAVVGGLLLAVLLHWIAGLLHRRRNSEGP